MNAFKINFFACQTKQLSSEKKHPSTPYIKSIEHVKIALMIWTTLEGEGSCLMAVNIAPLLIKLLLSPRSTLNTATWGIQTMFGECNLSHNWYTFCVSGALDLRQTAVFEIFLCRCCSGFFFFLPSSLTDLRNSVSVANNSSNFLNLTSCKFTH